MNTMEAVHNQNPGLYAAIINKNQVNTVDASLCSIRSMIKEVENKTGINFIIVRKWDNLNTLYSIKNGFRSKICDIYNNTSIETVRNQIALKLK
jgi:hypothetical protein